MLIVTGREGYGVSSPELNALEVSQRIEVDLKTISAHMGPLGSIPCHDEGRVWLINLIEWLKTASGVRMVHPRAKWSRAAGSWMLAGQAVNPAKLCAARPGPVAWAHADILEVVQKAFEQVTSDVQADQRPLCIIAYNWDVAIPFGYEGAERAEWVRDWLVTGAEPQIALDLEHWGVSAGELLEAKYSLGDGDGTLVPAVRALRDGSATTEEVAVLLRNRRRRRRRRTTTAPIHQDLPVDPRPGRIH